MQPYILFVIEFFEITSLRKSELLLLQDNDLAYYCSFVKEHWISNISEIKRLERVKSQESSARLSVTTLTRRKNKINTQQELYMVSHINFYQTSVGFIGFLKQLQPNSLKVQYVETTIYVHEYKFIKTTYENIRFSQKRNDQI